MRKLLLILSLFAYSQHAQANNARLDSLITALQESPNRLETGRINYLISYELRSSQPLQASAYIMNAIVSFRAINEVERLGKAHYLAGFIEEQLRNEKQAAKNYLYAANYLEKANDKKNLVKSHVAIANQALNANNLGMAEKYLQKALGASKDYLSVKDLGLSYLCLGDVYFDKHQYSEALKSYNEARVLLRNDFDVEISIAATLIELKQLDKVKTKLSKLESTTEKQPGFNYLAVQVENLKYLESTGNTKQALTFANTLLNSVDKFTDLKAAVLFAQWGLYTNSAQHNKAIYTATTLVAHCQKYTLHNHLLNFLPSLAAYAANQNQATLAIEWYKLQEHLQQTVVLPRLELEKNLQLELLAAEQEFKNEMGKANFITDLQSATNNVFWLRITAGTIFIIAVALFFVLLQYNKKERAFVVAVKALYKESGSNNLTNEQLALKVRIIYRLVFGKLLIDNYREDEGQEEEEPENDPPKA